MIEGEGDLSLHHLYRAMAFVGEEIEDHEDASPLSPRCTKEPIQEGVFLERRVLFTRPDPVFFDTTSLYFEGAGGERVGQKGHVRDHRPDLNQIVVGTGIDDSGKPVCCEIWPSNTGDVNTLIPVTEHIRNRFHIAQFCIAADRGMISNETLSELEKPNRSIAYILGTRMRKVNEIRRDLPSRPSLCKEVCPEVKASKDPAPLKAKEVSINGSRYIVCSRTTQARKDALDRQALIESLKEKVKRDPKILIGNEGYRKYHKVDRGSTTINEDKIELDSRFDGKWVLKTNKGLSADQVVIK